MRYSYAGVARLVALRVPGITQLGLGMKYTMHTKGNSTE
jgi:hypothetical protein